MKRFAISSAGLATVALAGVASADINYSNSQTFEGYGLSGFSTWHSIAVSSGTLTGLVASMTMTGGSDSSTWASDLAIFAMSASGSIVAQLGGYSQYTSNYSSMGSSGGSMSFSGIDMTGGTIFIGNGWHYGGATTWDFNVTAVGVVPAPGALALIGFAGLASRRRRS